MDAVQILKDSFNTVLPALWKLLLAMSPFFAIIAVPNIIKTIIGRVIYWITYAGGESKRAARRKSKFVRDTVDLISGINDLSSKK
ncbi:MAG: hypothetical protein EOM54_10310 [Clostridia bacterium]|nr:hypothetical protein [Clostridia bacterium]